MARKRMIDPSFWTDEKLGECSIQERLLFMGLISNADDEGRGRGNHKLIKSAVFPYDDIKASEVEKWLKHLHALKLITIYEIDGQSYYQITNFLKHQTINKATKSSLPAIVDTLREDYGSDTGELQEDYCLKEVKRKEVKRREENIKEYYCTEPETDSTPEPITEDQKPVITLPLNDKSEYPITQDQINEWSELYPAVDVSQALRTMRGWCLSNPQNRKTKSGVLKFITGWLARDQNKGSCNNRAAPPLTKAEIEAKQWEEMLRKQKEREAAENAAFGYDRDPAQVS